MNQLGDNSISNPMDKDQKEGERYTPPIEIRPKI